MDGERIRRVLRLRELGKSQSEIAREVGISRAAVQDYTRRAQAVGLSAEEAAGLVDEEVRKRLNKNGGHRRQIAVELNVAEVITELSQKGVTLELLYRELVSKGKMPCSYSTFCRRVKEHECKIRRQPITDSNLNRSPIPKLPIARSKMPDH
jgi:predicted transcriptional regulator